MIPKTRVYLSLGGNIGDSYLILNQAIKAIKQMKDIEHVKVSSFYCTSPVGSAHPDFFVNAVCSFTTSLTPKKLLKHMQFLEIMLGKIPKPKSAPRLIDIDILFYGSICYKDKDLQIPHPHWKERLFVLIPLLDLVSEIKILMDHIEQSFNIRDLIYSVKEDTNQTVSLLEKNPLLL